MKAVKIMSDAEIEREIERLEKAWNEIRTDDVGHGGSPGEGLIERLDELDAELAGRREGGRPL